MRRLLVFGFLSLLLPGCAQLGRQKLCDVCLRPVPAETRYLIHLQNGETREVCCPRCGLHFQTGSEAVTGAEVTDYESEQILPASGAIFVENSSIMPCCKTAVQRDQSGGQFELHWDRCMPSLIAFRNPAGAEEFRRHHGGTIKTYAQLMLEAQTPRPNR